MIRIGFTGTQRGMTNQQIDVVILLFQTLCKDGPDRMCAPDFVETEFHMGDCIGADKRFWELCQALPPTKRLIGHIPDNNSKRAFCKYGVERTPKPYVERNHDIVDESDYLIATPGEYKEQLRSGTWSTIRYARKKKKKIVIIYPDGAVEMENVTK